MKTPIDIHSCSYYCHRPECIKAQRDELRVKYAKLADAHSLALQQNQSNASMSSAGAVFDFQERLADAIEDMPFGDTAASFARFVRNFK